MYVPIFTIKDIAPTPPKIPVVTLIILVLFLFKNACARPSITVGKVNTILNRLLKWRKSKLNKGKER